MNTSVTRLDGTRTILSAVSHGIGRAVSRCLYLGDGNANVETGEEEGEEEWFGARDAVRLYPR